MAWQLRECYLLFFMLSHTMFHFRRYLYYMGRVQAIQLEYSDSYQVWNVLLKKNWKYCNIKNVPSLLNFTLLWNYWCVPYSFVMFETVMHSTPWMHWSIRLLLSCILFFALPCSLTVTTAIFIYRLFSIMSFKAWNYFTCLLCWTSSENFFLWNI